MEQQRIIPTRYKNKIPQTLSYPVGAEVISKALIGVPQFDQLELKFWFSNQLARRPRHGDSYRVLQAEFAGPWRPFSAPRKIEQSGISRIFTPKWTITVYAVPRSLRNLIQGKIVAEALPSIRTWLLANPHSAEREGSHGLIFVLDELKNELKCEENASVEWGTTRADRPR